MLDNETEEPGPLHFSRDVPYAAKKACHHAVQAAVKAGLLAPQPCEVCQRADAVAHHDDYAQPLRVMWLCQPHHVARHVAHASPSGRQGRPVSTGRGKAAVLYIRLSDDESAAVTVEAEKAGERPATWARNLILSALAPAETPAGFLRAAGLARAKQRTKRKVK